MSGSYDDLIGKPYAPRATGPEAYDCWGICVEVLKRLSIFDEIDLTSEALGAYNPEADTPEDYLGPCRYDLVEEPRNPGDIVILRGVDSVSNSRATHAAIHIGRNMLLHSTRSIGVHCVPYSTLEPHIVEVISWRT